MILTRLSIRYNTINTNISYGTVLRDKYITLTSALQTITKQIIIIKKNLIKTLMRYSQFRISEIKTARPRIPSPLTAGIFQMSNRFC